MAAVSVSGLMKSYKEVKAVDNVSFDIKSGEIFGLVGHNGAGKSTTIECILGTKDMDGGTVEVLGMNPRKQRRQLYERVGVQFQQSNYQDKIRVDEVCELTTALYSRPSDWKELLKTFGLEELKKHTVSELSGGERQKLSVLQALIPNPELVFLDELTTGLDTGARREVWKQLAQLKKKGLTILLTSHYMDEVEALCDRVCILKRGRIAVMGTVKEVTGQSPYSSFEEAYLWYSGEECKTDRREELKA
jgi:ABC-2 type transport system ATP-binding protein